MSIFIFFLSWVTFDFTGKNLDNEFPLGFLESLDKDHLKSTMSSQLNCKRSIGYSNVEKFLIGKLNSQKVIEMESSMERVIDKEQGKTNEMGHYFRDVCSSIFTSTSVE